MIGSFYVRDFYWGTVRWVCIGRAFLLGDGQVGLH